VKLLKARKIWQKMTLKIKQQKEEQVANALQKYLANYI